MTSPELQAFASRLRIQTLELVGRLGGGHLGGMFSAAEILAVLYGAVLRGRPGDPARDRFILGKGHAALIFYLVLVERGFLPAGEIDRLFTPAGQLAAHPEYRPEWGIEVTSGSLGHGLALGAGMAFALKHDATAARTVVLLGDGECQEGSVAEAAAFAAHHRLDRLVAIIDANQLQAIQPLADVNSTPPAAPFRAAGWSVREIDGHDCAALAAALTSAPWEPGRPALVVARTVKGKGVSFMEHAPLWHYRCPTSAELDRARRELEPAR